MKKPTADFALLSLPGTDKENEDCVKVHEGPINCFVLADGLGGHGDGALAAGLAADAACATVQHSDRLDADLAARCFTAAQCAVTATQKEKGINCRCTMTLLLTDGARFIYGHIGDSRVYHMRRRRVVSRTLDHSVPQLLLSMGTITEAELAHHPDRSRIIRAVGGEDDSLQFELSPLARLRKTDSFLLCSDGFWEWIEDDDIIRALTGTQDAAGALEQLAKLAEERSQPPRDDCSAILVRTK